MDHGYGTCSGDAQIGSNKGEAHHALKNGAPYPGRQGENSRSHDRGQHYRIAGLNLLTAVIFTGIPSILHAVTERGAGLDVPPTISSPHIPPLGWAHILH
ncbi:Tn3 family transposase [Escherichia coli]